PRQRPWPQRNLRRVATRPTARAGSIRSPSNPGVSSIRVLQVLRRWARAIVNQGVTPALPDPLKRRVRLGNGLSAFAAMIILASIPFDWTEGPRALVVEDIVSGIAYLLFPL